MNAFYGIIPARFKSTRLEGKPLADIQGKPMFWHVYHRAKKSCLKEVYLATDHEGIAAKAAELQVPCVMTSSDLKTGSERVLQAAEILNLPEDAVLVNIQGDEPLLEPEMLNSLVAPFKENKNLEVCTLARALESPEDKEHMLSSNLVKVTFSQNGNALYFSRSLIPYNRDNKPDVKYYGHIGLYAFTHKVLKVFNGLAQSPLELTENLEQLRFLENNIPIKVVVTPYSCLGVDTLEDLEYVRTLMPGQIF